ncbi:laminin subunit alpha-1 isoform X2 [Adelges cooleyi]|uniref:laminin subunit alpha-1 isoform X2 n=1 Tax=Adelges cooleyi TaxID=133065 RepID=UPI00217F6507|nr:laminin subunit alpha-1 isoform X2 [Adelges cooleyi]
MKTDRTSRPTTAADLLTGWLTVLAVAALAVDAKSSGKALYPSIFNLASRALVTANATCGEAENGGPEVYCRFSGASNVQTCGVCDARAGDPAKAHGPGKMVDNSTGTWWQSPSLQTGDRYQYVTLNIDLKQVYQVSYIIIKFGISSRPGNWILERSTDDEGSHFRPWQYFAVNNEECVDKYGVQPATHNGDHKDKIVQVNRNPTCVTSCSRFKPHENGEIHINLLKGHGSISLSSPDVLNFTTARLVRFRLQKIIYPNDKSGVMDTSILRKLFYSIRDVFIGGRCVCHGHAKKCKQISETAEPSCDCQHNTCGQNCDRCSPLYNQRPWKAGPTACEQCQCYGHATECRYDPTVDAEKSSLDLYGTYSGGGVCVNCSKHTTGINCERCETGWYRPLDIEPDDPEPCLPCECHPEGSDGTCVSSKDTGIGLCDCFKGFAGDKCDECAPGYSGFPDCEPCACDERGIKTPPLTCDSQCDCKDRVNGNKCDRCKPGYFNLNASNPEGCDKCFCSGVSTTCDNAVGLREISISLPDGWLVTDLKMSKTVFPSTDADTGHVYISSFDVPFGADSSFYWLSPDNFTGNKLTSYGSSLKFSVSWILMRGDSSGRQLLDPDVVIIAKDNILIAYGGKNDKLANEVMGNVALTEKDWFYVTKDFKNLETPLDNAEVSRDEFLSILSDVKHVLIKAKYHTDQVESSLNDVSLTLGHVNGTGRLISDIENCSCPFGYTGLSCEACDYGFVKHIDPFSPGILCKKCDCHGHSPVCDQLTGHCSVCEHNTTGAKCNECLPGFYGNATWGTSEDCKKCACPLEEGPNNFNGSCEPNSSGGYMCTNCPEGHTGDHCELCASTYYGNPMIEGSTCKPCDCNGAPCNNSTGQCTNCLGNTVGWNCKECKPGHFGNPIISDCRPCDCHPVGSITTDSCNMDTGQCQCKDNFTGRTCDRCVDGLGNTTAKCVECTCNHIGSITDLCDPRSGICPCKKGITGASCDTCIEGFHSFSSQGCVECQCNTTGSENNSCDPVTGQCNCRQNVTGSLCDSCKEGHWNITDKGCQKCGCDELGAVNGMCDPITGQCVCKPGVSGQYCDQCLPNYYGFSILGCSECQPCEKQGHVCDMDTGRCVCPQLTEGPDCSQCVSISFGWKEYKGCQECRCDSFGSLNGFCHNETGACVCRTGYSGSKCDQCSFGYYGYPRCRPCACDYAGSEQNNCNGTLCGCDEFGQCECKMNVYGKRCDQCKEGTFGLHQMNADGCIPCFCFGRSSSCSAAGLTWNQIRLPQTRTLSIHYDTNSSTLYSEGDYPVNTQEICYINLANPESGGIERNQLNITNNLRIIPGTVGNVEMGVKYLFDTPVYWQLPNRFSGDKVSSYGGYIRFTIDAEGGNTLFPQLILTSYPLIQIQGNEHIILEHFPQSINTGPSHQVRLHESLWQIKNNPGAKVSREILMLALQNIKYIFIRATDSVDFTRATLKDVWLETATMTARKTAHLTASQLVEVCECPPEYQSSSCQDPSLGYFRYYNSSVSATIIIQTVGEAKQCQCNGRSNVCNVETGNCENCTQNTGGAHCEICAEGFYGDPFGEGCQPCPCPSVNKNFAKSCEIGYEGTLVCQCKPGYKGPMCDQCEYGWFGYPRKEGGSCEPCRCNKYGMISDECDEETGQCNCMPNITGRDCSVCQNKHVLTSKGCMSCEDKCIDTLLDDVSSQIKLLNETTVNLAEGMISPPWSYLLLIETNVTFLSSMLNSSTKADLMLIGLADDVEQNLKKKIKYAFVKAKKSLKASQLIENDIRPLYESAESRLANSMALEREVDELVINLQTYGVEERARLNIASTLKEAQHILNKISNIDFEPSVEPITILRICSEAMENLQLNTGSEAQTVNLKHKFETLLNQVKDFDAILSNISIASESVNRLKQQNKQSLRTVNRIIEDVNRMELSFNAKHGDMVAAVKTARENYLASMDNFEELSDIKPRFENIRKPFNRGKNIGSQLDGELLLVNSAEIHAEYLLQTAQKYAELFKPIKHDANVTLQASNAYLNIVKSLQLARNAAINASQLADTSFQTAYPGVYQESLVDKSKAAEDLSQLVYKNTLDVKKLVDTFQSKFNAEITTIEAVKNDMKQIIKIDNSNSKQIIELEQSEGMNIELNSKEDVDPLMNTLANVETKINEIQNNIDNRLRPVLLQLNEEGEPSLTIAQDKIDETEENGKKVLDVLDKVVKSTEEFGKKLASWNDTIAGKLEALRNKITEAHQIADGIRISVTGKENDTDNVCIRTYQPKFLEPSTRTTIVLSYAISTNERDALLFYLSSKTTGDFVAIEMVNRKIRFVWDVGGGIGEITHPMHIQTASDLNNDQHWYRIEAERVHNFGKLLIRPQVVPSGSSLAMGSPHTNMSSAGMGRLDVNSDDVIWIGGIDKAPLPSYLHSRQLGLIGCLHQVWLDGRPIGLWNFKSQPAGTCSACIEGAEEMVDDSSYRFTGDGYAVLHHDSTTAYNKYLFSVSLNFKTFDERSLLFLAEGSQPDQFIDIRMQDGKVIFRVSYSGYSMLELSTASRYNVGTWTRLEATRYFDRKKKVEKGVLKVGAESKEGVPSPPPNQNDIPELSEAEYMIGGVPPGFKATNGLVKSFSGCMSDIQIAQQGYNPMRGNSWGVQTTCTDKPLTIVGFYGNGYLELTSHTLKKKASFGFMFATLQQDALLMMSTTDMLVPGTFNTSNSLEEINNNIEQENKQNYYSVSLRRGQVDIRINAGHGEIRLASEGFEFGDGKYHSIMVTKNGKKLELRIDDVLHSFSSLPEGSSVVRAPGAAGGLFLGGLPAEINTTGKAVSSVPLVGTIKDAIFNDQLLYFDSPIEFEHAAIGQVGPVPRTSGNVSSEIASMTSTEKPTGCGKEGSFSLEPGAVKFGDNPNSYVQVSFSKRHNMHRNFKMDFRFRSFYSDGLVFLLIGNRAKQNNYLAMRLYNGRVQLVLKNRKRMEISTQAVFNDGMWHRVQLIKDNKTVHFTIDSIPQEKLNLTKKLSLGNTMYVGGVPAEKNLQLPESLDVRSFKGCMQGFAVNHQEEELVSERAVRHQVGQCFPQVEKGSFFPGDAYAIYKNKYYVGALLELSLELRTTQTTAVLLSVSEPEGYPALSLELNQGKVVLSGDMGDRRPFRVEQSFHSEFTICDNKWHQIQAFYVEDKLTLKVDQFEQKYWLLDNGHITEAHTNSPLYIGGLPDTASSGTLGTRDNFKGCIRNLIIGSERTDWADMASLHNILLSSCPLIVH